MGDGGKPQRRHEGGGGMPRQRPGLETKQHGSRRTPPRQPYKEHTETGRRGGRDWNLLTGCQIFCFDWLDATEGLPGHGADEERIHGIADQRTSLAEGGMVRTPPKDQVGIEQILHASSSFAPKASAMSSGGASKSGEVHISPGIEPGVRGAAGPC